MKNLFSRIQNDSYPNERNGHPPPYFVVYGDPVPKVEDDWDEYGVGAEKECRIGDWEGF